MLSRVIVALAIVAAVACAPAAAATAVQIDEAVERGVRYLLSTQEQDGGWSYSGYNEGSTALVGLALLEGGVKPSDPAIQRTARYVRARAPACSQTYSLALMIFFLDRLGERQDKPLLVTLGERLRNGQLSNGAWSYFCAARAPGAAGDSAAARAGGDNSNTQFAVLGLWVARRHGVDVQDALARLDKYFRSSQGQDGGWMYISLGGRERTAGPGGLGAFPGITTSTGAMTCAGLLGLLTQFGSQTALRAQRGGDSQPQPGKIVTTPASPLKDPAVQAGLKCLEQFLMPQTSSASRLGLATEMYFLWSVERVGVAYGLKKIGIVDWYEAGADRIVAQQQADGSWSDHSNSVGTSLALLFLKRANVASDLTRLVGGDSELRSTRDLEELKNAAATQAPPGPLTAASVAALAPQRLKSMLPALGAKEQRIVLEDLRDRKGSEATLALADAIELLDEPLDAQGRKFLAERMKRMTPATLVRYLEYDHDEIQRAAAQAAEGKQDRSLIGPLVALLEQRNAEVADAAHAALRTLTGQQFGPFAGQSTVNRFVVIKKWKAWWEPQSASPKK